MSGRAVRIVTEVAAVDRAFDYAVPESLAHVRVGDRVRVDFHNRSVRGWVVDEAPWSEDLKSIKKWLGLGPPPEELDCLRWAGERWYAPVARLLLAASPDRVVSALPTAPSAEPLAASVRASMATFDPGVIQVAPTTDPLAIVLGAYEATRSAGSLLVLVPTESWASRLLGRLEQRGCHVASNATQGDRARAGWPVVVGARGTALAPVPRVGGAVIIDADDEAYRSSGAPTWDATSMLRERCRRDGAPLWCTSVIPSPALLDAMAYQRVEDVAGGWPRVAVVDRRMSDPHDGVLSRDVVLEAHRALDGDEPVAVVVVLQRLGTGRLFACATCGDLARCVTCGLAEEEVEGALTCPERHERRANFCRACGGTKLKRVRTGVTTLARDVAAQHGCAVSEVSSATRADQPLERVVVATEAVFQRVRRCSLVVFVDFDQYLLAPRASSRRSAIIAVAKAGRLVGSRRDGRGTVTLQTRRRDDAVVTALELGSFDAVIDEEVETARILGLAPFGAAAVVSGEGASEFVEGLASTPVVVNPIDAGYVLRAKDPSELTTALWSVTRPTGRVRVAVE